MAQDFMVKIGASMDVGQVESAIKKLSASLGQLKIDPKATADLTNGLEKLKQQVETFKDKSKNVTDEKDMSALLTLAKGITKTYDSLIAKIKVMSNLSGEAAKKLFPPEVAVKIKAASKALEDYRDKIVAAEKSVAKQQDKIDNLNSRLEESAKAVGLSADGFKNVEKAIEDARKEVEKYNEELEEAKKAPKASDGRTKEGRKVKELTEKRDIAQSKLEGLESNKSSISKQAEDYAKKIADAEVRLRALQKAVTDLNAAGGNKLKELTDSLKTITGLDLEGKSLEEITTELEKMGQTDLANLVTSLQQAGQTAGEAAPNMGKFAEETKDATEKTEEFDRQAGELASLKSRIAYFFGAQNAINLFKKAIRSAFNSVKELDEIMTQTAVVTKFDVSDMWDQLPEYTERANALGVAISDAYKSATLFYQQGLKTNEVIEVSNQTLKMARIAGLDAADATDKMTAALRGFNMEVNGTNAERISDVYSKLAAITASNVQEISTAMTKTASLASNAGMQFETTAAFLSQIIETTRESAETAGTALKTVIARFQELKKSPDEIGEVDGEVIDANKIEGALRTVGVALRDTSGQFRDLDQVFMELASKWDSLDTNTQRYIATIAAGSRQQSRFIAMMSDYKRTTELVEAANNAAGASNQQYEKTLESMQTTLNRLKNAWNEFTMGIANSSILKKALQIITGIINAVNKLTKALGSTAGGFVKLGIAIGGLKVGGKVLNTFFLTFTKFKKSIGPVKAATKGLAAGFKSLIPTYEKLFKKAGSYNDSLVYLNNTFKKGGMSTKDYGHSIGKLIKTHKSSTDQIKIYRDAIAKGATAQEASIVLTNKEAAATVKETIAKNGDVKATLQQVAANDLENKSKMGILTKLKLYFVALFSLNKQKRLEALLLLKGVPLEELDAKMKDKQTVSQLKLNAAMLACPIFWIIAAVAALIVGIILLVKWLKNLNSTAAKYEKVNKTIEQLNEELDETKSAIEDIKDQRQELENMNDTFKTLTKGSEEWKEQLSLINGKVLDLIDKYPELAQYLGRGGEGQLMIEDAGWDAVLKIQEEKASILTLTRIESEASREILKTRMEAEDAFNKEYKWSNVDVNTNLKNRTATYDSNAQATGRGLGTDDFNELSLAIANAGLTSDSSKDELKKVFDQFVSENDLTGEVDWEKTYGVISDLGTDFDVLGTKVQNSSKAIDGYTQAFAAAIVTLKSTNETLNDQLTNATAHQYKDIMKELEEKVAKDNSKNKGKDATDKKEKQFLKEYKQITGTKGSNKKIIGDVGWDEINRVVETNRQKEKTEAYVEKLDKNLNIIQGSGKGATALNLLSTGGSKVRGSDLEKLRSQGISKDAFKDLDYDAKVEKINELLKDTGVTFEELEVPLETFVDGLEQAEDGFTKAYAKLTNLGMKTKFEGQITKEAAMGLSEQFSNIVTASGLVGAGGLQEELNAILSSGDWNLEDLDSFTSIINGMDWKSADAWESLTETLATSGVRVTDDLKNSIEAFAENAKKAAGAIHKIDFANLVESVQATSKVVKDIKSGAQGRTFDSSTYEALVKANKDLAKQFQLTLSGEYVYLGSSMEVLTEAIEDNTAATLMEANKQLIARKDFSDNVLNTLKLNIGSSALQNDSTEVKQDKLDQILRKAHSAGINLDDLGINGLGNSTIAFNIQDDDKLTEILTAINNVNWGEIDRQYEDYLHTSNTLTYQKESGVSNVINAAAARSVGSEESLKDYKDRSYALRAQAAEMGVNSKLLQEYITEYDNYIKGTIKDTTTLVGLEEKIGNTVSLMYSTKQVQAYLGNVNELLDQYNKIEDTQLKIIKANEMVSGFGLKVDEDNLEDVTKWINGFLQGDIDSYENLINAAMKQVGKKGQEQLVRSLAEAGLLVEEIINGEGTTRLLTESELKTNVNLAGTNNEWENPYDYLTNANEKINGLIRERSRLERQYQNMIEKEGATSEEIVGNLTKQLGILREQAAEQIVKVSLINEEIQKMGEENAEFSKYAYYDSDSGSLTVDYEGAESAFKNDASKGKDFEDYIDKLRELQESAQDATDELSEIYDNIDEIKDVGKEQYLSLEQNVFDGLVKEYEDEIDKLSEINDSVNDANNKLIESLQSNIDKMRQDRENEKAVSNIEDKQRRLDYLMMDTSGANELEILKLQDEIANDQESLTDSLIDQAIQNMQDENQKAQEQREEQIELMRAQLEYQQISGALWESVHTIMEQGFNGETERLITVLQNKDNFMAMSEVNRELWINDLNTELELAKTWNNGQLTAAAESVKTDINTYTELTIQQIEALNGLTIAQRELLDSLTTEQLDALSTLTNEQIEELSSLTDEQIDELDNLTDEQKEALKSLTEEQIATLSTLTEGLVNAYTDFTKTKNEENIKNTNKKIEDADKILTGKIDAAMKQTAKSTKDYLDTIFTKKQTEESQIKTTLDSILTAVGKIKVSDEKGNKDNNGNNGTNDSGYKDDAETAKKRTMIGNMASSINDTSLTNFNRLITQFSSLKSNGYESAFRSTYEDAAATYDKNYTMYSNIKGTNMKEDGGYNWGDLRDGKNDDGKITNGSKSQRVRISGSKTKGEDLAQLAYSKGIKDGQVFKYNGSYYLLDIPGAASGNGKATDAYAHKLSKNLEGRNSDFEAFKSGGYADFTGPAWLDGTPSHPEAVLNAADTERFIALIDTLRSLEADGAGSSGDNYFDINIEVESISGDYDVERMADKIKEIIVNDAAYRNVNSINLIQ